MFKRKSKKDDGNKEEGKGEGDAAEEGGDKPDGVEEEKSVGEMKRGDYMIHIYVEKAKDLKTPQDSTVNPIVEI